MPIDRQVDMGQKEGDRMPEHMKKINHNGFGCMDGRGAILFARKVQGTWVFEKRRDQAAAVVEAKIPGGGLGYIATLERIAGVDQDTAIEITEEVFRKLGITPQLHIDNDHGHFTVEGKTDEEIIAFLEKQTGGCGFAGRTWGEGAVALIKKLIGRGWLVEVLDGHHNEGKAKKVQRKGMAINPTEATQQGDQTFTYNEPETIVVTDAIEEALKTRGIAIAKTYKQEALSWYDSEFAAIANALSGGKINAVTTVQ